MKGRGAREVIFWSELVVDGNVESECWLTLARPKHLELPRDPGLKLKLEVGERGECLAILTADKPALFVFLDSAIPGLRFSDNFFHMRPGRPRVIGVTAALELSTAAMQSRIV